MSTLDSAVRRGTALLARAGVPSPRVDAETLLANVLGTPVAALRRALVVGGELSEADRAAYEGLLARRADRVPLQHLTGQAHFRGLTLRVGPGVFVPRPETEVLVELALRDLAAGTGTPAPVVVDLCTGSGAIALAIRAEWPAARVYAVELSAQAYRWARRNLTGTGLPVDLRLGPAEEACEDLLGSVHLVVSNPPYIPPGAVPRDPEVRRYDPAVALYGGGADGLQVPMAVARRAAELLVPGGALLMEHAEAQGQVLPALLRSSGDWAQVDDHRDLAGLPRVVRAVRGSTPGAPRGRPPAQGAGGR